MQNTEQLSDAIGPMGHRYLQLRLRYHAGKSTRMPDAPKVRKAIKDSMDEIWDALTLDAQAALAVLIAHQSSGFPPIEDVEAMARTLEKRGAELVRLAIKEARK